MALLLCSEAEWIAVIMEQVCCGLLLFLWNHEVPAMVDNDGAFVLEKTGRGQRGVASRKGSQYYRLCSLLIKGFLGERWFRVSKSYPNCAVMPIQLSPSTPVHSKGDKRGQLCHGNGACLPMAAPPHTSPNGVLSRYWHRSTGDVSGLCMLYSWHWWDLKCYRRFVWPEDWSQLSSAWKWN